MVDLLDEVKDELREQKVLKGIKLFSIVILITLIISVISVLGWNLYKSHIEKTIFEQANKFNNVVIEVSSNKNAKLEDILKKFEVVLDESKTNYSALAGFQVAQIYLMQAKPEQAINALNKIVNMKVADSSYKEFAELLMVNLQFDNKKITHENYIAKIESLFKKESYLKYSIAELLAIAKIEAKKFSEANQLLATIHVSSNALPSQVIRATQLSRLTVTE